MIRGHLDVVSDKNPALDTISERLLPGRISEIRGSTRKEAAATLTLALTITDDNWLMKTRTGGPGEPVGEVDVWCGVVPLHVVAGTPQSAPWSVGEVPESVRRFVAARLGPTIDS